MKRKTITFPDAIYKAIQTWRANTLLKTELDFNFTQAVLFLLSERLKELEKSETR